MSQTQSSKNRSGVLVGVVLVLLLIILVIVVLKIFTPDGEAGSESGPSGTPATGIVVFQSYYIEPERINAGNCATLHWAVENADNIQLLRDVSVIVSQGKASDSYRDCPTDSAIYKYRLEASNSENANWIELQLIVDE